MIPDINVLNAIFNLEGISTFAMILVTVLREIAMIYRSSTIAVKNIF